MFNKLKIHGMLLYDKFASFFGEKEPSEEAKNRKATSQVAKDAALAKHIFQMNCSAANHSNPVDPNHCYLVHILPNSRMGQAGHEYLLCQNCLSKIFKGEPDFNKLFGVLSQFQARVRSGDLQFLRWESIHTPITPEMEAMYQADIPGLLPAL